MIARWIVFLLLHTLFIQSHIKRYERLWGACENNRRGSRSKQSRDRRHILELTIQPRWQETWEEAF